MEFNNLLSDLKEELALINQQNKGIIKCANLSVMACEETLLKMNKILSVYTFKFKTENDEIYFFKKVKNYPLMCLIYFLELRSFELLFPKIGKVEQKKYIKKRVKKISSFFKNNIQFLHYIRDERTDMDNIYFTRAYNHLTVINDPSYYRSPEFSTSHDIVLGKLNAYDKLLTYLKERLMAIENPKMNTAWSDSAERRLQWTGSKVALTELIYALYFSGTVNYGKAKVKDIALILQKTFNIEIDDIYKVCSEIKLRKKSRIKFMNELCDKLISGMEDSEEYKNT